MEFYKLQATGNDFIVTINDNKPSYNIKTLCDRNMGIGADGLINIDKHFNVNFFNADGSEANLCGNGLRCLTKLMYILTNEKTFSFNVKGQVINAFQLDEDTSKIIMPTPMMIKKDNGYFVNVLNNHLIYFISDINNVNFNDELSLLSKEDKCNIHFVEIINKSKVEVKTYEYGVKETKSCGSGSLAVFYALYMLNKVNSEIDIISSGGTITCGYKNNQYYIKGEAKYVYKGEYYGI